MVERSIAPWVLVADAEPYICRVFEAKLTKNNSFRVICATTGAEALRAAAAISFDALLWDLRLRDTHNSLARLRSFCPNAALILMSTDDLPGLSEEIDRLDVADVLVKPFSLDLLVSRLDLALEVGASTRSISMHLTRVGQAISVISPMGACRTRVMETYPDRIAVVGPPRVEAPSDFAPGTRVKVELDGADALYSFHSRLVPESASMVPGWQLRLPRILRREQRRKYVRADVRLDISLYARAQEPGPVVHAVVKAFDVPEAPPVSDSTEPERVSAEGVTDDLCVGGCAVITRRRIPVGATVDFEIGAASHEVSGRGLVIRSRPLPPSRHRDIVSDPERYRLVVQFDRLDSAARRTLESLIKEFN